MEILLEILTEEMPASHVRAGLEELGDRLREELEEQEIAIQDLWTFGTPRRLIVTADIASGQPDSDDVVSGPPKSVGLAPDGSYTQAALGFARSQGVPVESLAVVRTAKGEYLGFKRVKKGRPARAILGEVLPDVIAELPFPKTMRWGEGTFRFSRPIHNILCLVDGTALEEFVFEGLRANDTTRGHRILAPQALRVRSFAEYRDLLRRAFVIIDPEERRAMVESQIKDRLAGHGAELYPDPELLEMLVYNVEYPFVILGSFPESYLSLPLEVLSTAMREGQRLLAVVKEKKQLPLFIGLADAAGDAKELIRHGNERVLRARLEDARFFWDQDRKLSLTQMAAGLRQVVFQEKLGSYDDKAQRLKKIVAYLCDKADAARVKKEAVEAAALCKADLVTGMVKEFPSLQGKVGGLYARLAGAPAAVSSAIYEHYQPVSLDDPIPASTTGALLSVADKIDTVVGVLGLGIQVTGSSDPFGLRRGVQGISKILLERRLSFSLGRLLEKVIAVYGTRLAKRKEEVKATVLEFFAGRLRYICETQGFRYDLVNAGLAPGVDNVYHAWLRVKALDGLKASPAFEPFILMAKRVNNILRDQPAARLNPGLFEEKEERELFTAYGIVKTNAAPLIVKGDFSRAQAIIFRLQPCLNAFFDKVLVMAEDKKVRQNRLALLQAIQKLLLGVADYSHVVLEGESTGRPAGR